MIFIDDGIVNTISRDQRHKVCVSYLTTRLVRNNTFYKNILLRRHYLEDYVPKNISRRREFPLSKLDVILRKKIFEKFPSSNISSIFKRHVYILQKILKRHEARASARERERKIKSRIYVYQILSQTQQAYSKEYKNRI